MNNLKKVFILPQFGPPHSWSEDYLAHIRTLEPYGWYWKILTPHPYVSGGNVEVIPMTLHDFDNLVAKRTGVATGNFIGADGIPVKLISDYYPALGDLLSDYLQGFDYWSAANWDMVYGRIDHFLPDSELEQYEIWSDDNHHINSIFCFYQNVDRINQLYRSVPGWQKCFQYSGRPLVGFDEVYFDAFVRGLADAGELAFGHPPYFALHSYDRLIQHKPEPNLAMMPDGALIECFEDNHPTLANYPPWRGYFGRELMYFHFIRTKRWPKFRK